MSGVLARPDHLVETNFFSTDDGPVWTNISDYVELQEKITVSRRRQTVFDEVAPATAQYYLDNSLGTFNNDQPTSPFYGVVNVDVPTRLRIRWPNVGDGTNGTTRNLLSDVQSACTDSTQFTVDQGGIATDTASSTQINDDDDSILYIGTWTTAVDANDYNGSRQYTSVSGANATCTFYGTGVAWYGAMNSGQGIASVSIDGGTPTTVDLYKSGATANQVQFYTISGLPLGYHTIQVSATGTKNAASTGINITVDYFLVTVVVSAPAGQTSDIVWNTGVLDQTGVGVLTGSNPSRVPDDHPVYVKPNTTYSARAQVNCDTAGAGIAFKASLRIRWYDLKGNQISDSSSAATTLTASYQPISVTATSPANAAMARVGVFNETVVGPQTRTIVFTGGFGQNQRNSQGASIWIPASAQVGDLAMCWHRVSTIKNMTQIVPAGWTLHHSRADANGTTFLYTRRVTAADIGKRFQWIMSKLCKHELVLTCYSGVDTATPISVWNSVAETVFRKTHTTPNITTVMNNQWIVSAVFDTSTTTSSWSPPAGETVRTVEYTTSGNAPNGLATDDAVGHAAGTYGSKVFTSNAASRYATMHTLALNPATGTGPGNVAVQFGAVELVEGSLTTWQQGGHWESKFTGNIDQWAETFNGDAVLTEVQATDRQKILNTITVGPAVYEDIRDSAPIAYYMLNESSATGSTTQEAANSADVSQPTLTQVTFGAGAALADTNAALDWGNGVGPGTDGTAALMMNPAAFNNGLGLQAALTNALAGESAVTLSSFFNSSQANDGHSHVMAKLQDGTHGQNPKISLDIRQNYTWQLQAVASISTEAATYTATATASGAYFDGHTHMITGTFQMVQGQMQVTIYVDGVNKATATTACSISEFPTMQMLAVGNSITSTNPLLFTGTLSHVAVFDYALDDSTINDIWNAGNTAFAGDTVDQRMSRLCQWENQNNLNLDATTTVLDRHMPDSQSLLDALQQAARSEGGTFYVDGEGNICFKSRVDKETTYTPLITVKASQVDPETFTKVVDDTLLVNKPVITRLGSGVQSTLTDPVSTAAHGVYEKDVDTLLSTDADAKNYAAYLLAFYDNPAIRCDQVKISALFLNDWSDALQVDMWEVIRITGLPSTEAVSTIDLFIEGWEFDIDHESWDMVFDTSTAIPFGIVSSTGRQVCGQVVVAW